jgi:hypothetical protein
LCAIVQTDLLAAKRVGVGVRGVELLAHAVEARHDDLVGREGPRGGGRMGSSNSTGVEPSP